MNEVMNGIIDVLKPSGMTSFDVVAHLRGLLGIRKIGHAGTLDPLAAGVLPMCIGRATRAIEFLMDKDKYYRAELTLGVVTDSQDSTGNVISTAEVNCSDTEIEAAVRSFTGKYLQMPPMHSALKVGGKRLYELARDGVEIERQQRELMVYSSAVLGIERDSSTKVMFDVHCSKGTYIRTLCADIGERIGCGGHMSFLLRKRAGPFEIKDAFTLEDLAEMQSNGTIQTAFLGVESIFCAYPCYKLDEQSDKKFRNGMNVKVPDIQSLANESDGDLCSGGSNECDDGSKINSYVRVYSVTGKFIALGEVKKDEGKSWLKVKKFF